MPTCYVKNCTNRTLTKNIKFFQFPKEPVILQQWLKACGKNEVEIKTNSGKLIYLIYINISGLTSSLRKILLKCYSLCYK